MDLALSEEQQMLAQAAADFLAAASTSARVRTVAEVEGGFDRALWQQLAEQGWCGVQASEIEGGMGLGWVELALLQEQLGRHLACVPYFDSLVMAGGLLRAAGERGAPWLATLLVGEQVAVVAADGSAAHARQHADGAWQLDGRWPLVASAPLADVLLLAARDEHDGAVLLAVPAASVRVVAQRHVDATRCSGDVHAEGVRVPAANMLMCGNVLDAALRQARDHAAIALAAEQVGVAGQCLDLAVAFTAQRVQFGRPIAGFQAVKHRCARMLVELEAARSAVLGAAAVADTAPEPATLTFHAAQALDAATTAAQYAAQEAIQLHGGVGFTWEYDPQLYFKHAQANSMRLGAPAQWLERVAALLLDGTP